MRPAIPQNISEAIPKPHWGGFWGILVLFCLMTGCEEDDPPTHRLVEGEKVEFQANNILSVPISISHFPHANLVALLDRSFYQKETGGAEFIDWIPLENGEVGSIDSSFVRSTPVYGKLKAPRSVYYLNDSTIFLFCQGYFSPNNIWIVDRYGNLRDSIDISQLLQNDISNPKSYESLYAGPENPILYHDSILELQSLPYLDTLFEENRNRHFFAYGIADTAFTRHKVSHPSEYFGPKLSFGYQSPFTSLINHNSKLLVGFQASPTIYIYDLKTEEVDSISVEIDELPLSNPKLEDDRIPLQKSKNGQYGPIYFAEENNLFIRQFFLPCPEDYQSHNPDSLNFPHKRPSVLVVFDEEGNIRNDYEESRFDGLGQQGFFDQELETLFIIRSSISYSHFSKGQKKIEMATFIIDNI